MTRLLFLWCAVAVFSARAQDKPAYALYTGAGKTIDFSSMIKQVQTADVVLFGELHGNAMAHWLELQVLKAISENRQDVVLGMEMFEADDQVVLDEYLKGVIEEKHLLSEAKIWENYNHDYRPLVEWARERSIPVIATNIPRRYANLVYRKGIESLNAISPDARRWMMPLPVTIDLSLPGYKNMIGMGGHGTTGENMVRSQAVKDATMAHFILSNRKGIFLHINGAYHSQDFEGIVWYLKKAEPKLNIVTLHAAEQKNVSMMEDANRNKADFILSIPADMTQTH